MVERIIKEVADDDSVIDIDHKEVQAAVRDAVRDAVKEAVEGVMGEATGGKESEGK